MKRTGRPRRGSEKLTAEKILTTALALVDEYGVEQLTMRRLAKTLKVDPMALYHYFDGKPAILAGIARMIFGQFAAIQPRGGTWRSQVRAFANDYRRLTQEHPNFVRYLVTDVETAIAAALPANERLYAALDKAGLSAVEIVNAADLIVDYLNGLALAESSAPKVKKASRYDYFFGEGANAGRYPILYSVLSALKTQRNASRFETQLEILLDGIARMADKPNGQGK